MSEYSKMEKVKRIIDIAIERLFNNPKELKNLACEGCIANLLLGHYEIVAVPDDVDLSDPSNIKIISIHTSCSRNGIIIEVEDCNKNYGVIVINTVTKNESISYRIVKRLIYEWENYKT